MIKIEKLIQIRKNFGITGVFLFMLLGTINLFSQSFHQSQLVNKEWVLQIPGKSYISTMCFTDTEQIWLSFTNNGVKTDLRTFLNRADKGLHDFYYLSDTVVDTFQRDSVGKSKSGKYIIILVMGTDGKGKIEESLSIDEIMELTDTTLKTKYLRNGIVLEYHVE
jgi:hypothetical protein